MKVFFQKTFLFYKVMSLQNIKNNATRIKNTVDTLKNDLNIMSTQYNIFLAQHLREENAMLLKAVGEAKQKLELLEVQNGVKQIPVPSRKLNSESTTINELVKQSENISDGVEQTASKKPKEVKIEGKIKKLKETKEPGLPIDIGRLDLRIGHIDEVEKHPEADTLYLLKISCGEEKPRTVCSGLVKHVPLEKLKNRHVVVLCNLKPVKMRGIVSEAMVMCASCEEGVEVLLPPPGCTPGELVECEGYTRNPDPVMNPKKKIFETVAPDLHTNESLLACYKNNLLIVPGKGNIVSESLKNVPIK